MSNTPPFQFFVFLLIFNGILWSLHYWVYRRLTRALSSSPVFGTPKARKIIAAVMIAFDLPWIFLYIYRHVTGETPNMLGWLIMYPFAVWQAVLFFWIVVLTVYAAFTSSVKWSRVIWRHIIPVSVPAPAAVPAVAATSITDPPPPNASRRRFLRTSSIGLTGYALAASSAGVMFRDEQEINEATMVIPGLPEEFRGFRIALISDIHSGIYMDKAGMQRYANLVNGLKADMIVLPGDYVNSLDNEIYPFAEAFSALHAPYGVFGVTGNHDYFANADLVCRESEQAGIRMLRNEHAIIEKHGQRIALLGIDDAPISHAEPLAYIRTGKSEPIENMLKGVPADLKKVLLCHRPYPFEEFAQIGMDVMLSGHTHGGQIVLAKFGGANLSFAQLASKFVQGSYRAESNPNAQMYVSRGIGTVGLPLRINCPPEITTIVLS